MSYNAYCFVTANMSKKVIKESQQSHKNLVDELPDLIKCMIKYPDDHKIVFLMTDINDENGNSVSTSIFYDDRLAKVEIDVHVPVTCYIKDDDGNKFDVTIVRLNIGEPDVAEAISYMRQKISYH